MGRPLVVATSRSFSTGDFDAEGALAAAGLRVARGDTNHDLDSLRPLLASAFAWIAGTAAITVQHLAGAPRLRLIARYGVGVDAVDLAAATGRGVAVTNTPDASTGAVADLTIGLMLAALRGIPAGDAQVRAGDFTARRGRELGGATVGVVGFGRIGQAVAARLAGFGCEILAHDPWIPAEQIRGQGTSPVTMDLLTARSDILTLHIPGGERLVTADWLAAVQPTAVLVNAARAGVVDEAAVAAALRTGRLGGYASDTLAVEHGGSSPLLAADLAGRTIFTPHAGASTREAVDRMGRGTVAAVLAAVRGDPLPNRVAQSAVG